MEIHELFKSGSSYLAKIRGVMALFKHLRLSALFQISASTDFHCFAISEILCSNEKFPLMIDSGFGIMLEWRVINIIQLAKHYNQEDLIDERHSSSI